MGRLIRESFASGLDGFHHPAGEDGIEDGDKIALMPDNIVAGIVVPIQPFIAFDDRFDMLSQEQFLVAVGAMG